MLFRGISILIGALPQGFLLQRLEILKGRDDVTSERKADNLSHENQSSLFVEDEVEMPDFPNEHGLILNERKESASHPGDEIISEDEDHYALSNYSITSRTRMLHKNNNINSFGSVKQAEACTWSMINKEARALIHLNETALTSGSFAKAIKSSKGVRGKGKPKFSLHPKLHKDGLSQSAAEIVMSSRVDYMPEQVEPIENGITENSNLEFFEIHGENEKQLNVIPAKVEAFRAGLIEPSMVELLDDLQDKNVQLGEKSKMSRRAKGKSVQFLVKKSISPVEDGVVEHEEQLELVTTGSSDDDEANYEKLNPRNLEMKNQTMADRFQEAFASTSFSSKGSLVIATKLSGIGLFGKLQQVIQSEKERDADFVKNIQMGTSPIGKHKEVVPRKTHMGSQFEESSQTLLGGGRRRTVIFSPNVCNDVDFEVGNLICIHSPWKEVEVMGHEESIILATYFSQI